jgi:hypothetical protein
MVPTDKGTNFPQRFTQKRYALGWFSVGWYRYYCFPDVAYLSSKN